MLLTNIDSHCPFCHCLWSYDYRHYYYEYL